MDEINQRLQWYPGHMTKTKRMLISQMSLVDVVVELLDARIPHSSQNPDIDNLTKNKKRVLVLNKADLACPKVTALWERYYTSKGCFVMSVNAKSTDKTKGGMNKLASTLLVVMKDKLERQKSRGRVGTQIKAMIVGIPNVGKSTFINQFAKKSSAKVADKPGVTRGRQWIKSEGFDLLDTPGILWPKFDDPLVGINLASTGAISDNVFDKTILAAHLLSQLQNIDPEVIYNRYFNKELRELSLDEIGKARGFKLKGDKVDTLRAAIILLDEFRGGKLGRISLEKP